MSFLCPHCSQPIDPALIIAERQRELASRPRPTMLGKPSRNPHGRAGKPKTKHTKEKTQ